MSYQRSVLWKTLKYSQSQNLEGIHWILWIYTDAAPVTWCGYYTLHHYTNTYSQWPTSC